MWLSFYNQEGISDTLLLTSGTANRYDVAIETKNGVTRVLDEKMNTALLAKPLVGKVLTLRLTLPLS